MVVVGLRGPAGAGKDTAGDYLVRNHKFTRVSFADNLREAALALDPYVSTDMTPGGATTGNVSRLSAVVTSIGWEQAKTFPDVRRLLQRFGTDVGRELWGTNFWVERTLAKHVSGHPSQRLVFTDVRFDNEVEAVLALGGHMIHIERPGLDALPGNHVSERGITIEPDHVVVNDGTPTQLGEIVARLIGLTP